MTAETPRCRFCEHKTAKHGVLGCEHQFPILTAYGADKGKVATFRGCPCQLTRTELHDGVDIKVLAEIKAARSEKPL